MDKELQERIISSIPRDIPKSLVIVLWDFVLLGLIAFLFGVFKLDPLRAWQTFLINFLFWSGISLSGIVFAATFQVTDARWGRSVKRLMEGMGFFLPVSFVLFAEFDNILGTGFHTSVACSTIIICYNWKAGFLIHVEGIKITCSDTVPMTQTSILATGFTGIEAAYNGT